MGMRVDDSLVSLTMEGRMATLADVAALAGVSKATASRAFSRPEVVSAATATRVMDAAEKLDFVASRVARQLARGRTGVIALTVPTLDNSFFTPIIAGAQAQADTMDMQLTVVVHPLADVDELRSINRLRKKVDGIIAVAPAGSDDLVALATMPTATVLVDREINGIDSVAVGTPEAFGVMVSSLADSGCRRITYIGGPAGSWQDKARESAVATAAAVAHLDLDIVTSYDPTFAAGVRAAEEVRSSCPDAIIPYATAVGLGVQHVYLAAGEKLPVITSERDIAEALGLNVPTIDVDGEELGRHAVSMLMDRMANPDGPRDRQQLPVHVQLPKRDAYGCQ